MAAVNFPEGALRLPAYKLSYQYLDELCAVQSLSMDAVVMGNLRGFELTAPQQTGKGQKVSDVRMTIGRSSFDVRYGENIVFPNLTEPKSD